MPEPQLPEILRPAVPGSVDPDVPLLYVPGLAPIVPRSRTLMSCHFRPLRERFWHSGRREFFVPACRRGEFRYITVYDSQQECMNTSDPHTPPNMAGSIMRSVSVESIVQNLIENWGWMNTGQMSRVRLGVFEIKGTAGTEEEKRHAQRFADASAKQLVEVADRIHLGLVKGVIDDLYRDALEYLGSENKPWYRGIEPGTMKRSVVSGNRIPVSALVDQGVDLIEYYVKYGLNPMDYEDSYLRDRPELLRMARKRLGLDEPPAYDPPKPLNKKRSED